MFATTYGRDSFWNHFILRRVDGACSSGVPRLPSHPGWGGQVAHMPVKGPAPVTIRIFMEASLSRRMISFRIGHQS